jgi:hypothetical protein
MIVVIAVLGLIFTMGAIRLSSAIPKYRLRTAAREVGTKVEDARLLAVSHGSWTGIRYHLDSERSGYEILPPAPPQYPDQPIEERKPETRVYFEHPDADLATYPGVRVLSVEMRAGEVLTSGVVDVYFSPTGTEGSHIVRLGHRDGRLYTMTFNALTGTVDFYESEGPGFEDFED